MNSAGTILVLDDDVEIRRLVAKTLEAAGYKVKLADGPEDILQQVFSSRCSLVIVGTESIDVSYINILRDLRTWSTIPVIVLSSLLPEEVLLAVSTAGTNDYITKPFSRTKLLSSVRSALQSYNATDQGLKFETDAITIDFENRTVSKKGALVKLTPTEFLLLSLFVHNRGKVLTHNYIVRQIRGPWFEHKTRYSRVYVGRLRKKLEDDPDNPQLFRTESGRGYKFVAQQ
jgi:two-component system KDP operon response regulator KdpE